MPRRSTASIAALAASATAFLVGSVATYAAAGPGLQNPPRVETLLVQVKKSSCGKYKRDGTGNCLTPAFYKCQRDWQACSKTCKPNEAKCIDACEIKYAPICGD